MQALSDAESTDAARQKHLSSTSFDSLPLHETLKSSLAAMGYTHCTPIQAETLPLAHFEPMLRRVFAEPRHSIYRAALD